MGTSDKGNDFIKIDEYVDFIELCKEMSVKYRFILDSLLLTAVDLKDESQIKLIASFAEDLKVSKEELQYLVSLAKAILEQNLTNYVSLETNYSNNVPNNVGKEYVGTMFQGQIYSNNTLTIIYSSQENDVSIDKLNIIAEHNTPMIKLENIHVSIAQYPLAFQDYQEVIIENCAFDGEKYPIKFINCDKVIIKSCVFRGFSYFAINEDNVGNMEIKDTLFEN